MAIQCASHKKQQNIVGDTATKACKPETDPTIFSLVLTFPNSAHELSLLGTRVSMSVITGEPSHYHQDHEHAYRCVTDTHPLVLSEEADFQNSLWRLIAAGGIICHLEEM